jgi:phage gp16-like protein
MSERTIIEALCAQVEELKRGLDHWHQMAKRSGARRGEERAKRLEMEADAIDNLSAASGALWQWREWASTITNVAWDTDVGMRKRVETVIRKACAD